MWQEPGFRHHKPIVIFWQVGSPVAPLVVAAPVGRAGSPPSPGKPGDLSICPSGFSGSSPPTVCRRSWSGCLSTCWGWPGSGAVFFIAGCIGLAAACLMFALPPEEGKPPLHELRHLIQPSQPLRSLGRVFLDYPGVWGKEGGRRPEMAGEPGGARVLFNSLKADVARGPACRGGHRQTAKRRRSRPQFCRSSGMV